MLFYTKVVYMLGFGSSIWLTLPEKSNGTFLINYDVTNRKLDLLVTWSTIRKQAKRLPDIIVETTNGMAAIPKITAQYAQNLYSSVDSYSSYKTYIYELVTSET